MLVKKLMLLFWVLWRPSAIIGDWLNMKMHAGGRQNTPEKNNTTYINVDIVLNHYITSLGHNKLRPIHNNHIMYYIPCSFIDVVNG